MAQPATAPEHLERTVIARARRYEREAVAELCDRNLDRLYRMCEVLTGTSQAAEEVVEAAFMKALDGLPDFEGEGQAFDVWLLRLGASVAARRRAPGVGLRARLGRLSNFDYELVALRVLGEVDSDRLSPALNAPPANLRAWLVSSLRELDGRAGSGWGYDLRAFDAAIGEVVAGADPDRTATTLTAPPDAQSLLGVVAQLRGLLGGPIPAEVATRLRTRVLAEVAERRVQWVHRHHVVATVPGVGQRRYPTRRGTVIALALATILAMVVGASFALLSSFAEPNSLLYPLKLTGEGILVAMDISPVSRADLETKLARTREREAEDMAVHGQGWLAVEALRARYQLLLAAGRDLLSVPEPDRDQRWRSTRDAFFAEEDKSETLIERDLEASGQRQAESQAQAVVASYERNRRALDAALGRRPTRAPTPGGSSIGAVSS
ncbi:MAG TPA: sigma factor [Candidatus Dormibacteraeota bacterium]|nr:sigma factor [Candidatus Dormibacteraeota bacterium]